MNESAKANCANCSHVGALHVALTGHCRLGGCRCEHFRAEGGPPSEGDGRTVTIRIPDGYAMTVTLTPVSVQEEATDAA